ncbi:hypothetical protein B296_00020733 [Ensete ventricosum]|uniref:Uncharacterized protein n=1 Tax=Ensete ventricosum TaxID=4639 RepID=A0A426ZBJ1_ENSVE|nr:hypothetical protein B296_00020733 [Ensete ventricosum]
MPGWRKGVHWKKTDTRRKIIGVAEKLAGTRQPYTLKAAISFARHQEEQLNYEVQRTRVAPRPAAPKLSPPSTVSRPPQLQKLIREDSHDGSAKGLYGCCNKLWSLEHHCKKEKPLMIMPIEESKLEDMTLEPKEKDTPQPATHTVPTLVGYTNPQKIKDKRVTQVMTETQIVQPCLFTATIHPYILFLRDKLLLKCYILSNSPWLLI